MSFAAVSLAADLRPESEDALADIIKTAHASRVGLEITGGGSKRAIGRQTNSAHLLSTRGMRGITLYEPNEMVMAARSGTLLSEVQSLLLLMAKWTPEKSSGSQVALLLLLTVRVRLGICIRSIHRSSSICINQNLLLFAALVTSIFVSMGMPIDPYLS